MRRTLTLLSLGTALALPGAVSSQDDDRGRLERLIEDNLSADGMQIDIEGFQGALSSEAQLESLTIADANGVYLELRGVVLDWNRLALLRGRVSVNALTADEIVFSRLPGRPADPTVEVPDAAAQPFSLPELPVSVEIGEISADRVALGESIIGQPVEFSLEGSASLAGGEGDVTLDVNRTDGKTGEINADVSFSNQSEELAISLAVDEGPEGLVASLAGIPGEPPLNLTVEGEGPLSDFTADLSFATDGEDRLAGQVQISETESGARGFDVAIDGDIRPLLTPENREFFGPNLSLAVAGQRLQSGALEIENLDLASDAINLSGNLALSEQQWPVRFSLQGEMAGPDGGRVALPIPGQETLLDRAVIDITYDSEEGDGWQADISVDNLERPDLTAQSFSLDGSGTLTRGDGADQQGGASGDIEIAAEGLSFEDADLARAVGEALTGVLSFDWTEDEPLRISGIDLSGAGVSAEGAVAVSGIANDLNIVVAPDLRIAADDIARFSGLAGRELAGSVDVQTSGTFEPVSGAFDMEVSGTGSGLETGIPEVDGLVAGQIDLAIDAARTEAGVILRALDVTSETLSVDAEGRLGASDSDARFDLAIDDISRVRPELSGPVALNGTVQQSGEEYTLDVRGNGPGGARIDANVTARVIENVLRAISGDGEVAIDTLGTYSEIAGRDLGGSVQLSGSGSYEFETGFASADVTGRGNTIAVGIPEVDALLDGQTTFTLDGDRDENGITLQTLELDAPRADITANGRYADDGSNARFDVRLSDLASVVPTLSGEATLSGTASQDGETWSYDVTGDAPGGVDIDVTGSAQVVQNALRSIAAEGDIAAADLAPYSGLADRELGGSIDLTGSGSFDLESQNFTADVSGETQDILTGIAEVDNLMRGTTTLDVDAARDETGITVNALDVSNPQVEITGEGVYAEDGSRATFDATIEELSEIVEGMSGRAQISGRADQSGDTVNFDITGEGPGGAAADITGAATLDGMDPVAVEAQGSLGVDSLAPYSQLAGRELAGSAQFEGSGSYTFETMFFDADLSGRSTDVVTGIEQADTLLAGTVTYDVDATRNENGIVIDTLRLVSPRASVRANGTYADTDSALSFVAEMTDVADVAPGLNGPARIDGEATQTGPETWDVSVEGSGPGGAQADLDATARVVDMMLERIEGGGTVSVNSLAPYGALAGQNLGGSVQIEGTGAYTLDSGAFEADVDGRATNLSTGIAPVDQLIRGTTTFGATASRGSDGAIRIQRLNIDAAEIDAQVDGTYGGSGGDLRYDVRLANVGVFVPELNGPATANGTATLTGSGYQVDAALTGPGGATANVAGSIAQDFGSANLSADGALPLEIANPFLEPNLVSGTAQFDLGLNGPLGLQSLSGNVTTSGAEFFVQSSGARHRGDLGQREPLGRPRAARRHRRALDRRHALGHRPGDARAALQRRSLHRAERARGDRSRPLRDAGERPALADRPPRLDRDARGQHRSRPDRDPRALGRGQRLAPHLRDRTRQSLRARPAHAGKGGAPRRQRGGRRRDRRRWRRRPQLRPRHHHQRPEPDLHPRPRPRCGAWRGTHDRRHDPERRPRRPVRAHPRPARHPRPADQPDRGDGGAAGRLQPVHHRPGRNPARRQHHRGDHRGSGLRTGGHLQLDPRPPAGRGAGAAALRARPLRDLGPAGAPHRQRDQHARGPQRHQHRRPAAPVDRARRHRRADHRGRPDRGAPRPLHQRAGLYRRHRQQRGRHRGEPQPHRHAEHHRARHGRHRRQYRRRGLLRTRLLIPCPARKNAPPGPPDGAFSLDPALLPTARRGGRPDARRSAPRRNRASPRRSGASA